MIAFIIIYFQSVINPTEILQISQFHAINLSIYERKSDDTSGYNNLILSFY